MSFCSLSLTHFIQRKSFLVLLFPPFTFFIFIFFYMKRWRWWWGNRNEEKLKQLLHYETRCQIFSFSLSPLSSSLSFYYLYNIYFMLIVLITVGTSSRVESSFHSSSRLFSLFLLFENFLLIIFNNMNNKNGWENYFALHDARLSRFFLLLFAFILSFLPSFNQLQFYNYTFMCECKIVMTLEFSNLLENCQFNKFHSSFFHFTCSRV